jgi:hypothetical protein
MRKSDNTRSLSRCLFPRHGRFCASQCAYDPPLRAVVTTAATGRDDAIAGPIPPALCCRRSMYRLPPGLEIPPLLSWLCILTDPHEPDHGTRLGIDTYSHTSCNRGRGRSSRGAYDVTALRRQSNFCRPLFRLDLTPSSPLSSVLSLCHSIPPRPLRSDATSSRLR